MVAGCALLRPSKRDPCPTMELRSRSLFVLFHRWVYRGPTMLTCGRGSHPERRRCVKRSVISGAAPLRVCVIRQHHPEIFLHLSSNGSLTNVPPSSYPLSHILPPAGNGVYLSHFPAGNGFHVLPTRLTFALFLSFGGPRQHHSLRSAGYGNLTRFAPTHRTQSLYAEEGLLGGRPAPHGRVGDRGGADPQSTSLDA